MRNSEFEMRNAECGMRNAGGRKDWARMCDARLYDEENVKRKEEGGGCAYRIGYDCKEAAAVAGAA